MGFGAAPLAAALGLLATAGVIFLLYWLRPEPQPVVVPSNLIWRRVLDERRSREDFWRWLVSLVIALFAGLAVALSLARPTAGPVSGEARRIAVVVENSPSMAARGDDGESRWERAIVHVRGLFAAGSEESGFLLLDTAGRRSGRAFADRRQAMDDLGNLEIAHGAEHRFPDVSDLLGGALEGAEPAIEVFFVGDGVAVSEIPEGVVRLSVFEPAENAAITAFDVRALPSDPGRFAAFVEAVWHPVGGEERGVLLLQIDGSAGTTLRRTLRVAPGAPHGETVELEGFVAGPIRAVIGTSGADGFAADDTAYAYVPARNRLRVVFAGEENPYWTTALRLDPRVALTEIAPEELGGLDPASADILVLDGPAPAEAPSIPTLYAGGSDAAWLPERTGGSDNGPGDGSDGGSGSGEAMRFARSGDHPLLDGLGLDDAIARGARPFDGALLSEGAGGSAGRGNWESLAGNGARSLFAARELPRRMLAFAFPLAGSNLPLQPGFPILLSRALSWLTDVEVMRSGLGPVHVRIAGGVVYDADGVEVASRATSSELTFRASEPSLYYAAGGGRQVVVAASLLDDRVSDLNRSGFADVPAAEPVAAGAPGLVVWPFLALFAFLLILAEWVAFHRHRTV